MRTRTAYTLSTLSAPLIHIRTYLGFVFFMGLPVELNLHSLLAFLGYLHTNSISHKVMLNYMSSLKKAANKYSWHPEVLSHRMIGYYLKSISMNTNFAPTPRGIFDLSTLAVISRSFDILVDPPLFRVIFMLAFLVIRPCQLPVQSVGH